MSTVWSISEIIKKTEGVLHLPQELSAKKDKILNNVIDDIESLDRAQEHHLSFLTQPQYLHAARTTNAAAILIERFDETIPVPQIVCENPYYWFASFATEFLDVRRSQVLASADNAGPMISPRAVVHPSAKVGRNVRIGDFTVVGPGVSLGDDCELAESVSLASGVIIGPRTRVLAGVRIYSDCKVGADVVIHANTVIGADGFGYAHHKGKVVKIPQRGIVVIEDHVEIGALCSIDRAALGETRIGAYSKIDSKVQVGHNVTMGKACMISALCGFAGSSHLGDGVIMGGHSGVSNHVTICSGARIGGMTGVIKTIEVPGDYVGFPARKASQWRRLQVLMGGLLDRKNKTSKQL